MKKNYKSVLLLVSLLFLFILYLTQSEFIIKEIKSYTTLFFQAVFPSCFIFLLLSYLLIENSLFYYIQKLIKQKRFYFFLVSLISGYPAGSIYIKEALTRREITEKEANQFIIFSHFPNPLFVLYHCKILFPNTHIPILFYGIIIFSNLILYFFTPKNKSQKEKVSLNHSSFIKSFQKSLIQTVHTLLIIYGTSIFFYLVSSIILHHITVSKYLYVGLSGIFDLTNGVISTRIINHTTIKGLFLFFFIVFGSIPIHLQIKSILSDTSISYKSFLKGRILACFLCSLLWIINSTITI